MHATTNHAKHKALLTHACAEVWGEDVCKLQGRRPLLDDLAALDAQLHKSLISLKRCAPQAVRWLSGRMQTRPRSLSAPACTRDGDSDGVLCVDWAGMVRWH